MLLYSTSLLTSSEICWVFFFSSFASLLSFAVSLGSVHSTCPVFIPPNSPSFFLWFRESQYLTFFFPESRLLSCSLLLSTLSFFSCSLTFLNEFCGSPKTSRSSFSVKGFPPSCCFTSNSSTL